MYGRSAGRVFGDVQARLGRSAKRYSSQAQSSAAGPSRQYRWLLAAGAATAVPVYAFYNRVHLDSVPDRVHGLVGGNRSGSRQLVAIKDVLDRKDSDEVWVVINGDVYNMTDFLEDHPGGMEIIQNNKSKDVTSIFKPRHPSDQLEEENIPPNVHWLGTLDTKNATDEEKEALRLKVSKDEEDDEERVRREREKMEERGLGVIINMKDFEKFAEPLLSKVGWAYYASAGDDEITKIANADAYQKVVFRPRILRKVADADASTTILGQPSKIPVFISPAAMAKLGHPDGEVNLTKGAGNTGIIQVISSNASCSLEEMDAARSANQPLFFQLYVNRKREVAKELISKVNRLNMNAIFLTGDAPVGGKRERDLRLKGEFEGPAGGVSEKSDSTQGVSQAMFAGVDPDLSWEDLPWIKSQTELPIIIKGVQCVEDALLAYENGAAGILISNHGGRQLDTTRPSLDVLLEIRKHAPHLLRPEFQVPTGLQKDSIEHPERLTPADPASASAKQTRPFSIFIDGGINRGTDVVKALCLGADAVGVGRGFLYAQSVAGVQGVEHAVGILESEILLTMRLLGANKLQDLRPSMVEVNE